MAISDDDDELFLTQLAEGTTAVPAPARPPQAVRLEEEDKWGRPLFQCPLCEVRLPHAKMGKHMWGKHRQRSSVRSYIDSSTCRACGKDCKSRPSCILHTLHNATCKKWLVSQTPLPRDTVDALDARDAATAKEARRKGMSPFSIFSGAV